MKSLCLTGLSGGRDFLSLKDALRDFFSNQCEYESIEDAEVEKLEGEEGELVIRGRVHEEDARKGGCSWAYAKLILTTEDPMREDDFNRAMRGLRL